MLVSSSEGFCLEGLLAAILLRAGADILGDGSLRCREAVGVGRLVVRRCKSRWSEKSLGRGFGARAQSKIQLWAECASVNGKTPGVSFGAKNLCSALGALGLAEWDPSLSLIESLCTIRDVGLYTL